MFGRELFRKRVSGIILILLLIGMLYTTLNVKFVAGWSNGGYSTDPSNPDFGTHDWIAQHALDWLPIHEKQYILDNLATYLYGTELPDNSQAPDGIGDTANHHIYYRSTGSLQDDAAAVRASEEYYDTLSFLMSKDYARAAKNAGIMSHYIVDIAVFGHVMGSGTDWGAEIHHSDYETYVNGRTSSYNAEFDSYLSFDGSLATISVYDAAKNLAYDTTFDADGDLTCVWMDKNYNWNNPTFKNRAGESLNLVVNFLTDVLHTLYLEATVAEKQSVIKSVNVPSKIYYTDMYWLNVTVHNYDAGISGADLFFLALLDGNYWFTSYTQYVYRGADYTWYYYGNFDAGTRKVYVVLYWQDGSITRWQDTSSEHITLVVRLYASNWLPQPLSVERGKTTPSTLTISFFNGGNDFMYDTRVVVKDSKGLAFSPTSQNVGNLAPGGMSTLSFFVTAPETLSMGSYNVLFEVSYEDFVGRTYTESKTATIDVVALPTRLSLSNPASAKIGETIAISARLIDSNENPLVGKSVSFRIDGLTIGTSVTDSSGNAEITYRITLPAGTYAISVRYGGSLTCSSSCATGTLLVYPLILTVTSTVNNTKIVAANGTLYSTDMAGKARISINQLGVYVLQIITPCYLQTDTRVVFVQWDDRITNNTRIVTMDSDQTFSTMTKIQYFLKVNAPSEASTIGQGWYDADSSISVKIDYIWNVVLDKQRNNLVSYTIDSGDTITVPRSDSGTFMTNVLMDAPHTITFYGVTQYYLVVSSPYGNVKGSGWYDKGSIASFLVSPTNIPAGFLTYHVFTKWSGDYTGKEATASISMDSPKTITADWTTDSTQLYPAIGGFVLALAIVIALFLFRRRQISK